ncbi:MAG: ABC transporter permease [Gemmatimonadaceae bacterium]
MSLMHPLRSLRRTPVFAAAAALTLALGIGSIATAFAITYGVLLEPLPYGHPDRLVSVGLDLRSAELRRIEQPPAVYLTYKRFARRIADIGFYRTGNANLSAGGGVADPVRLAATWVTASTIPLLQVTPILGRSFTDDEDRTGGPDAVVISESVWRTYFQASRDVVGRTLIVNSVPRTIVGVMPQRFMFPAPSTKLWLPARLDRDATSMGDFSYRGVARLAPGATPEAAQRELSSVLPRLAESFPRLASGSGTASWLEQARPAPVVVPLRDEVTSGIARTLWMLAAAAGLVLFVALANVANLMLVRADARQLELAVREALGASRLRIATHFLGESIVLTAAAGAAALLASWGALRALVAFGPTDLPRIAELHLGAATVVFVLAVSTGAAIICTMVPTVRLRRATLSINLRDGGRGETAGRARQRLRSTIAAFQVAVALVALAGSALLLRTFQRLSQERPGFDATNVMTVWTQLPFARYGDSASVAFYARLTESAAALPGVVAAGVTTRLPLADGEVRRLSFRRDDGHALSLPVVTVDDGYFTSMRIAVLAGPGFQRLGLQRDGDIVLSRRAVETFFRDTAAGAAIGRRVSLAPSGPTYTVVGVVGDVRDHDLGTPPSPTVYMPQAVPIDRTTEPGARRTMALVVQTHGPPSGIVAPIRKIVRDLDPSVPIFNVETMSDVVRASTARLSLTLALMSAAAAITLALGAIGLYGVMTYMVALRTRELGIRIALGAAPKQIARSVTVGGMKLLASGVAGGLVLYAAATPLLRGFLYGVTAADPLALSGATAVLVATAFLAIWLPARRASRVDPAVALRAD